MNPEAARALHICNVCRYCSDLCPVFEAGPLRPDMTDGDVAYLANLCHNCQACYYSCQYAPPHELVVNLPAALSEAREAGRQHYSGTAWLGREGLWVWGITLLIPLLMLVQVPWDRLFAVHRGPGAFYELIPWGWMTLVATLALARAVFVLARGGYRFWRDSAGPEVASQPLREGPLIRDLVSLRHLGGGDGAGCHDRDGQTGHARRIAHQVLVAGFALCFVATSVGTLYHHVFDWIAPYPVMSVPGVSGTLGGLMITGGGAFMLWLHYTRDDRPRAKAPDSRSRLLVQLLMVVALTGLILQALRETPAMGLLLGLHLGAVLAFFLVLPQGKSAHAVYRLLALIRFHRERR
ncbi:tricarballylate utilization 4Fe-4S protein TcuB [Halospina sp. K52047b]|uniref:tricarballylate utilization 4Fe-4S protein TcuB n=1 Tax=Halospina sp. K52047b TaxID=2614160 RepID=UPI00124A66A6|nr:tricarballylate utilization 4Fe-4S protein TcuB [Halospina sp. K52047b]KAA8977791.1 tricarballylate utilization 4Fe-4S protein TcuB [Halospina sp. K52047b]